MAATKPKKPARKRPPGPGEKSTGATGLVDEVESGDRVRSLLALRLHVAERIEEGVPARDLAALSLRLMQIVEELDALGANPDVDGAKPTAEDELAARRVDVLRAAGVQS